MEIRQEIAELEAELRSARLTKCETRTTVERLHDLQRQLEIDEVTALDAGDAARAAALYGEWTLIEQALVA